MDGLLAVVVRLLPLIEDDLGALLVELLSRAVCERDDRLRVMRELTSVALAIINSQQAQIARGKDRLAQLLDRQAQGQIQAPAQTQTQAQAQAQKKLLGKGVDKGSGTAAGAATGAAKDAATATGGGADAGAERGQGAAWT